MKCVLSKTILITMLFLLISKSATCTISVSFPNSGGSGNYSGYTYHYRSNPEQVFNLDISVTSPISDNGRNYGTLTLWSGSTKYYTLPNAISIYNNGEVIKHSWSIPENEFLGERVMQLKIEWQNGLVESTPIYYLITKSVSMQITGTGLDNAVVLSGCDPKVRLKAKGHHDPSQYTFMSIGIQEVNQATDQTIGNPIGKVLDPAERTDMEAGTFSIADYCTANGITLTPYHRYRVEVIMAGDVWAHAVQHFIYKSGKWDLVIRDFSTLKPLATGALWETDDHGAESNNTSYNIYQSPDVWNSHSSGGGNVNANFLDNFGNFQHENPDFVSKATNANYMFTKVSNIGCAASDPSSVRMFWTRARLGEMWSEDWMYDLNNNGATFRQIKVPLGAEITVKNATYSTPYWPSTSANVQAVSIPSIQPFNQPNNAYICKPAAWFPPDPTWFNTTNGNMSNGAPVICLLSRLQEANSVADPIVWEPANTQLYIDNYVRNNNNVATRNTTVIDAPEFINGNNEEVSSERFHTVIANNSSGNPTRICLENISEGLSTADNLLDYGELQVGFTNNLWNNWVGNGMNGTGFGVVSENLIKVTDPEHFCIENLSIGNDLSAQIGLRMVWNSNSLNSNRHPVFSYAMRQSNVQGFETYRGSDVVFILPTAPLILSEPKSESNAAAGNKTALESNSPGFEVYLAPNPADKTMTLNIYNTGEQSSIKYWVNDISGKTLELSAEMSTNANGSRSIRFNTAELSDGIYFISLSVDGSVSTKKIFIQH